MRTQLGILCLSFLLGSTPLASSASADERAAAVYQYQLHADAGSWTEALQDATHETEMARAETPAHSEQLAAALMRKGTAQLKTQDAPGAQASYAEAVAITEYRHGNFHRELVAPLRALGEAYAASNEHASASQAWHRAAVITRRNDGLFNTAQQELLKSICASQTALGKLPEAEQNLQYLWQIQERAYGADDPRVMDALDALGDWYSRIGDFDRSRQIYGYALAVVHRKLGDDPAMVPALRGYARSFVRALTVPGIAKEEPQVMTASATAEFGTPVRAEAPPFLDPLALPDIGANMLRKAVSILRIRSESSGDVLAATLLDAGDWYEIRRDPATALTFYKKAWALLNDRSAGESQQMLDHPVPIYLLPPAISRKNRDTAPEEVAEKQVLAEFTVDADGSVQNPVIVEEDVGARRSTETLKALRNARYRPRFVNGEPVATTGVRYRQVFLEKK
jgi:hypothetical protein